MEIDFIIERKGRLTLIEAKAAERVSPQKLNFSKVMPLLKNKYQVESLLTCNTSEKGGLLHAQSIIFRFEGQKYILGVKTGSVADTSFSLDIKIL